MPKPGTKRSGVFGKIPDLDRNRGVWSGSDRVPIGLGPNFPNTIVNKEVSMSNSITDQKCRRAKVRVAGVEVVRLEVERQGDL